MILVELLHGVDQPQLTNKKNKNMAKKLNLESMYQKISESFENANKKTSGVYKDFMRFEKGKDYILRLLPYLENPTKSIYSYKYRGWVSKSTGKYVEIVDPLEGDNPIQSYSSTLSNKLKSRKLDKDHPDMVDGRKLWNKKSWLMNVYVISDPTNSDNEGEVKILKCGPQLFDIINEHFMGDRKDEFGPKIFDISEDGCNLKVKVVDNGGGYPKYDKSYFMAPSAIKGVSDNEDKIEEIHNSCFNLEEVFPQKTPDEMREFLENHFINEGVTSKDSPPSSMGNLDDLLDDDIEEEVEEEEEEALKPKKKSTKKPKKEEKSDDGDEDDIDALIAGL